VIEGDHKIALATAYYDFVDPGTYSTVTPNPSHDGVHWRDSYGSVFWDQLIQPALESGGSMLGDNWLSMTNHRFDIAEGDSSGEMMYDTWARTDQISDVDGTDRQVSIGGASYSWIKADRRSALPPVYKELVLKSI
jgi:hypothetical protein